MLITVKKNMLFQVLPPAEKITGIDIGNIIKFYEAYSSFFSFLHLPVCTKVLFLSFARSFRHCFWKIFYESLSLRHYKTHFHCIDVPLSIFLFVLLNCKCSLSSTFCILACVRYLLLALLSYLVSIYREGAKASLLCTAHF